MKTKLLTICLLLVTSQVFAIEVTRYERGTESSPIGYPEYIGKQVGAHYITISTDFEVAVRCFILDEDKKKIADQAMIIDGVGTMVIYIFPPYEKGTYISCS